MADLIKKIKIKKQDGTFTDYIPIGAEAENVNCSDGESVEYKLNKKPYFFDTVADMKAYNLKIGDLVTTKGYYNSEDNGGCDFVVKAVSSKKKITLNNGLVAEVKKDKSVIRYIFPKNWGNTLSGDANLIIAYGKSILIDSHRSNNKNALYTMLNKYGISHIDYFISTHYHDDHVGNFVNLVNDGYVDGDTNIYLPAYYETLMPEGGQMDIYYNAIMTCISQNNLTASTPNELDTIELGVDFKITFYNCDASIFQAQGYTDYNDCSTICLIEHKNIKSLYTGDCGNLKRLIDAELIDDKINLYKIEHHGINTDSEAVYFLRFATPDYAIQPSGMGDEMKNNYSFCATISFLKTIGTKIYSVHENVEEIEFISENNIVKHISGKENYSNSGGRFVIDLYCDSNTTNTKQNGTQQYPYKDLPQTLEHILKTKISEYRIHLADGTYNTQHSASSKNTSKVRNTRVIIYGNSSDNTAVVLKNQLEVYDSILTISNVNFNSNGLNSLSVYSSYVKVNNCLFDVEEETDPKIAIWSTEGSNIVVTDSSFSSNTNAVSSHDGDVISIYNCNFEDITGYYLIANNSALKETNNTVTNCPYGINYSNNGVDIVPSFSRRKKLWSGGTGSGEITLSEAITNYNCLLVTLGAVSDSNGFMTAMLLSYGTQNFIKGGKYRFKGITDDVIFTIDDNDATKVTISHTNNGGQYIRYIYGLNMTDL